MDQVVQQPKKRTIYVPIEDFYKDPAVDLFKLLQIFWHTKWFIIGFSLICTLIAAIIILIPSYTTTAKISINEKASASIQNYLDSFAFKKSFLQEIQTGSNQSADKSININVDNIDVKIEYFDAHFSFRFNDKNDALTMSWKNKDPALALKNLEKILLMLQNFISHDLENENTFRYRILKSEFESMANEVHKIFSDYNSRETLTDAQLLFLQRYLSLEERLVEYKTVDTVQRSYKIIQPAKLIKTSQIKNMVKIFLTTIFSLFLATIVVLIYDTYRKSIASNFSE